MATSRVMSSALTPFQIAPSTKHTATVIFLHGLGDTGAGWLPVAEMLKTALPHVKWVLPNAPHLNVTANFGLSMPAWFDLLSFDMDGEEDRAGLLGSAREIDRIIGEEVDGPGGVRPERVVVGGFSQGGALSLLAGLAARGEEGLLGGKEGWKLGGVVALSGWLPLRHEFPKMASPRLAETPVLVCHGTADPIVPFKFGQTTGEMLKSKLGAAGLSFKAYESLEHSSCPEEIQDLVQFLKRVIPHD